MFFIILAFHFNGKPFIKAIDNTSNPVQLHLNGIVQEPLTRIQCNQDQNQFKSLGTYISGDKQVLVSQS